MNTVIITGATSGIGLAVTKLFLSKDFNCVLVARTPTRFELIKSELAGNFVFLPADVRLVSDCEKIIDKTINCFGGVDFLINCAGIYHEGAITDIDETVFEDIFSTNVKGTFFMSKAAVNALIKSRGAIINVASDAALKGNYFCAAYAASKGAIVAFTKSLALELASLSVRVNCVAPGDILTPLTLKQLESSSDSLEELAKFYPLGRIGTPLEVAEAIYFLATASFITGVVLPVDGGLSA